MLLQPIQSQNEPVTFKLVSRRDRHKTVRPSRVLNRSGQQKSGQESTERKGFLLEQVQRSVD